MIAKKIEPGFKDALFAKGVILVEGKTNEMAIRIMLNKAKLRIAGNDYLNLDMLGISIICLNGVGEVKKYASVLNEFRIPYVIVCDGDKLIKDLLQILVLTKKISETENKRLETMKKSGKTAEVIQEIMHVGAFVFEKDSEIDALCEKNIDILQSLVPGTAGLTLAEITSNPTYYKALKNDPCLTEFFSQLTETKYSPAYKKLKKFLLEFIVENSS